ncbi:hypothetical protein [Ignatzschineria sp. LJL83]
MSSNDKSTYIFEDIQPKDERIGARIKTQYRNALDLIARDRRTNISEVLELAIHKLAESYTIEGKSVLDLTDHSFNIFEKLFFGLRFKPLPPQQNLLQAEYADIRREILSYMPDSSLPQSLLSPQELYVVSVLDDPELDGGGAWYSITPSALLYFTYKAWHIGKSVEEAVEILRYSDHFVRDVLWKKYTADTTDEAIRENMEEDVNNFLEGLPRQQSFK